MRIKPYVNLEINKNILLKLDFVKWDYEINFKKKDIGR